MVNVSIHCYIGQMIDLVSDKDLLTDDVWRQLDPNAGRLPRRQTVLIWISIAVAGVLVAAGFVVWRGGYVVARVDTRDEASGYGWGTGTNRSFTIDLPIANDGRTAITVTSVGRAGPGLALTAPVGLPFTLAPGHGVVVYLKYTVTDCAAVKSGAWAVPVTVRMWWGSQTVYVQPGPIDQGQPDGEYEYSGADPYGHPWQQALAATSCHQPA
jgi:hypothetical protein